MSIPRFTAEASLYETHSFRVFAGALSGLVAWSGLVRFR